MLIIILFPLIVFAVFCLSAAAFAVLVGWLADFGIYFTEMCPNPKTVARREAEAKAAEKANKAQRLAAWTENAKTEVQTPTEYPPAIGDEPVFCLTNAETVIIDGKEYPPGSLGSA